MDMGEFIRVEIDMGKCVGIDRCGQCTRVCPVNIFDRDGDRPLIVEANEDECTLCDLCLQECKPEAVVIKRLYEE
jgi:NAD-dependent dihydropyrimidine dehydrogenase PreA subunit